MGFMKYVADAIVGTAEEILSFARQKAAEVWSAYNRMKWEYDTVHTSRQKVADSLTQIRYEVNDLRDAIGEATRSTHVGTQQCREALLEVTKNLTEAIDELESISILD